MNGQEQNMGAVPPDVDEVTRVSTGGLAQRVAEGMEQAHRETEEVYRELAAEARERSTHSRLFMGPDPDPRLGRLATRSTRTSISERLEALLVNARAVGLQVRRVRERVEGGASCETTALQRGSGVGTGVRPHLTNAVNALEGAISGLQDDLNAIERLLG